MNIHEANSPKDFEERVANLLRAFSYRVVGDVRFQGRQTDAWAVSPPVGPPVRIIIECKWSKVGRSLPVEDVTEFCSRVSLARASGQADLGWLVTNQAVPANAHSVLRESRLEGPCRILHPKELLHLLLNIPRYRSGLTELVRNTSDQFVEPELFIKSLAADRYSECHTFSAFVDRWLSDRNRRLAVLFGDYGLGKTTCCAHLLRKYLDDEGSLGGRIPLFVRLRDVANQGYRLPAALRVALTEMLGLEYHSYTALEGLAKQGLLLFIFDGLDESTFTLHWDEVFGILREMVGLAIPNNKVLVTSRPQVLPPSANPLDMLEQVAAMFPDRAPMARASIVVATLRLFDEARIRHLASLAGIVDSASLVDRLGAVSDLRDLASRPILLHMILETRNEVFDGEVVSGADLYREYTKTWLERDFWRSNLAARTVASGSDLKRHFVIALAWHMYFHRESFGWDQLRNLVSEFAKTHDIVEGLVDALANEIRICSFLEYDLRRRPRFAHESFLEYFVAVRLSDMTMNDLVRVLAERPFKREILAFLSDMLRWRQLAFMDELAAGVCAAPQAVINALHMPRLVDGRAWDRVQVPEGSLLDIKADSVLVEICDSHPRVVRVRAKNYARIVLRGTELGELDIEAPEVLLTLQTSRVGRMRVSSASMVTLVMNDSAVEGGALLAKTGYDIRVTEHVTVRSCTIGAADVVRLAVGAEKFSGAEAWARVFGLGFSGSQKTKGDARNEKKRGGRSRPDLQEED